nr:MAG TPA: hypothetical protein [Caudoviricetes sp.]
MRRYYTTRYSSLSTLSLLNVKRLYKNRRSMS